MLCIKICLIKFFIQNLLFISCFQIFAGLLSKCYQHQRTACWKKTTACGKKLFHEYMTCVCRTFGTIVLPFAFFMAIEFLVGVMTIPFALPIELNKSLWNSENG